MSRPLDVVAALTQVLRDVATPHDLESTLHRLVTVAGRSTPGVDHVSVAVRLPGDTPATVAATDGLARELAREQDRLGQGPCLDLLDLTRGDPQLRLDHLRRETRWPGLVLAAARRGVRSYVGHRFRAEDRSVGVLSLWSTSHDVVPHEARQLAELYAAHAGIALGHARRVENLTTALHSRTVIGLAIGMLMQRLDLDEDTAFAYLTRVSSTTETKLRDVAAGLVREHHERLLTRGGDPGRSDPV